MVGGSIWGGKHRHDLMVRLREDEVEYSEKPKSGMKYGSELHSYCAGFGLDCRDSKDNLRAKLLRCVRKVLGQPVFGPSSEDAATVRPPRQMSEEEMQHLFESRGCEMPTSRGDAVNMANALLVADGLLRPEEAEPVSLSCLTMGELVELKRADPQLSPQEIRWVNIHLIRQSIAYCSGWLWLVERVEYELSAQHAAVAAVGLPLSATDEAWLRTTQQLFSKLPSMQEGQVRQELAGRIIGFGFRRTKELMLPVLEDALAWDVLQALGGERRLEQWAVFAVAGMTDEQVAAPLEACGGGNAELLGPEYARHNVHALLPWAWVYDALRAEGR